LATSKALLTDKLSSPSDKARILAIAFGYFYFYLISLSTATLNASYNLVDPLGSAASTTFLKKLKSFVNSFKISISDSKKMTATSWLY